MHFTMLYGDYCYIIIENFPQKFSPCNFERLGRRGKDFENFVTGFYISDLSVKHGTSTRTMLWIVCKQNSSKNLDFPACCSVLPPSSYYILSNSTLRYECDETFSDECEFAARAEGEWCNHTCQQNVFRTSIVRNFISRGVKMRISAREACVKPHLRTRSDIKYIILLATNKCLKGRDINEIYLIQLNFSLLAYIINGEWIIHKTEIFIQPYSLVIQII